MSAGFESLVSLALQTKVLLSDTHRYETHQSRRRAAELTMMPLQSEIGDGPIVCLSNSQSDSPRP